MELEQAIEVILKTRAERFLKPEYLDHICKCVKTVNFRTQEEAFLFGALDAMQQDFASANQLTRPPKKDPYDAGYHEKRLQRLQNWKNIWESEGKLPFQRN